MHKLAKLVVKRRDLLVGFPQDSVPTCECVTECSDPEGYTEVEWAVAEGNFQSVECLVGYVDHERNSPDSQDDSIGFPCD
jgi:hypothetical protein